MRKIVANVSVVVKLASSPVRNEPEPLAFFEKRLGNKRPDLMKWIAEILLLILHGIHVKGLFPRGK